MADRLIDINQATNQSNVLGFAQSEQRLKEFIAELNQKGGEIRIYIPNASNFGHQSTSVHIMYRLAAMGVKKIRIVYDPGDDNWDKLYILILGLPYEEVDEYPLNAQTTLYFSTEGSPLSETMPLGITGGWDGNEQMFKKLGLQVDDFCRLQPFLWGTVGGDVVSPQELFLGKVAQGTWEGYTVSFPKTYRMLQRGYYFDQPTLTAKDREEFTERNPTQAELITTIETLVLTHQALLVPVYFSPGRAVATFHDLFFNLFLGIRSFQERVKAGPVIVLVMSEPQPRGYEALEATRSGAAVYNPSREEKGKLLIFERNDQRYQYLESRGYLNFLQQDVKLFKDKEDVSGIQLSEAVKTHSLVQVSALLLPRVVFDYMYGLSNLTMIFEGAGTGNLVMNLGKPFIRIRGADDKGKHIEGKHTEDKYTNMYRTNLNPTTNTPFAKYGERLAVTMETNADKWEDLMNSFSEKLPDEFIGDFLIDANRPYPSLYYAFRQQREFYHSIYEDKLSQALHYWLSIRPQERQ
ncbi:MAG TPA: hypothetical protein DCS93_01360 [Microscillaceae bacterium]|nr:hypothetical protein [Microscillaceae bacterium]